MVYYRKYRPQTISELDLTSVREKLSAILSSKDLPHAFLFTGSKGLGKTSAARILAKAINCTSSKGIEPCNKCEVCVSITNGSNLDVLEIDGASNGGVEEIRTLRERVKFASATLKKKVYIIDEVHMLSPGAFNALLKTLEEPPSHVVFVLATTELHKLPATVISRTFQIKFEKPLEEEVVNSLNRIVKGEDLKVDSEVLHDIYVMADGSFRDGAKILEELFLASKNKKITKELVESAFKTGSISDEVGNLLQAFGLRDTKSALEIIAKLTSSGSNFKAVIERLVDHLRGLLMLRNNIPSGEKDVLGLNPSNIKDLLELSNEAYGELRLSVLQQLPLELMVIKYCVIDVEQNQKSRNNEQETNEEKVKKPEVEEVSNPVIARNEMTKQSRNISNKSAALEFGNLLHQLFELVNRDNKPAAALLRSCVSAEVLDEKLIVTTPFPIHAERLKSEKAYPDLQKAAENLLGEKVEVEVRVLPN
jgi:DNA polymerase-3 subunit gamma/tau